VGLRQEVIQKVKMVHPFHIDAMMILPDHLHALWTLPVGGCDYLTQWMLITTGFSRQIRKGDRRSEAASER
jgi:putative transposase